VRLFLAVLLPDEVRAALAAEVQRLQRVARDVAWVAPDNLHVTLKFLGEVEPGRVEAVGAALGPVAKTTAAFDVEVLGLGAFPSPTRPRVVWAGLGAGAAPLAALAGRVDAALATAAFAPETRPFAGHVTLGRVREPQRAPRLAAALDAGASRRFGLVAVDRIALVRSDLSPRGARYTVLETWPLGPPPPGGESAL